MPPLLALPFPAIDPVAVAIGPITIKWYALAYVVGLVGGWFYARRLVANPALWGDLRRPSLDDIDDLIVWVALGVVLGGRLGYVLFYNLPLYLSDPIEILAIRNGGMSFHGGFLGAVLAMLLFARSRRIPAYALLDIAAVVVPIGLFFGRIANFVNGELWGRVAPDFAYAVVFPSGGPLPRHPSQLYEAATEGALLFVVMGLSVRRFGFRRPGLQGGIFVLGYAVARTVCEFFREPDRQLGYLFGAQVPVLGGGVTMGMLLCIPMAMVGIAYIVMAMRGATRPRGGPRRRSRPMPPEEGGAMATPLLAELRGTILENGPIGLDRYMALCLGHPVHGYYRTRDPLGAQGDFVTAPEISQMFGELIGLWIAHLAAAMAPAGPLVLAELGPGRGTLMADALRAIGRVRPDLRCDLHLVETSPVLTSLQAERLEAYAPTWHESVASLPGGPAIVVANEFFDALPVRQFERTGRGWCERLVGLDRTGTGLAFGLSAEPEPGIAAGAPVGALLTLPGPALDLARRLARRLGREGGACLAIDYGHGDPGFGDTLQAVAGHRYVDPLARPGEADLTSHVDFAALAKAAAGEGARVHGPVDQRDFLLSLGLAQRAERLAWGADPAGAEAVAAAFARLTETGRRGMGSLFKALAFGHPDLGGLPGFPALFHGDRP